LTGSTNYKGVTKMNSRVFVAIVLMALVPTRAYSAKEEESCGPQDYNSDELPNFECVSPGENELVPTINAPPIVQVNEGEQIIPEWDGALIHKDKIIEIGLRIVRLRFLRWMDGFRLRTGYKVDSEYEEEEQSIQLELVTAQKDAWKAVAEEAQAEIARSNAWWRKPVVWAVIGAVIAGGVAAITYYFVTMFGD
jgi:hypothetical protein